VEGIAVTAQRLPVDPGRTGRDDPDPRAGQLVRRNEVRSRLTGIETAFGDPGDPGNPVGYRALLAADQAGEISGEGLKLHRELALNAEFVPEELGGRLRGLDTLGLLLRPLFRRDVTLALGGTLTSFMAAMTVWTNGDPEQRRRTADVLLGGGVVAIAFQQFAHGNDFVNDEFRVGRSPAGPVLRGSKAAVNNAACAELMVAFARAEPDPPPSDDEEAGGYSLLLVPLAELPADRIRTLDRVRTLAAPGLDIRGLAFDDCPLPPDALVGDWGQGSELGLRAYPITHATVPAMLIGVVDTALRTAAASALARGVNGRPLLRASAARNALAATFVDLLVSDCLALTATRALHLIPEDCDALAAVAKYLVPKLVGEALNHLSLVMGDALHETVGDHAIFHKHVRDLDMVVFGHASSAVCQATIAPCLPGIAAAPWTADRAAPPELFLPYGPVPPLDPVRLARFGALDGLTAHLAVAETALAARDPDAPYTELLNEQAAQLRVEVDEIRAASLGRAGPGTRAGDAADAVRDFPLTDRYALILAALCCLGVWLNADPEFEGFGADPLWLVSALDRLLRRLGRAPAPPPRTVAAELCAEVLRRTTENRSCDLYDLRLAG
jgi:alkylation response protein AidB-like acyl-CoA dehydrogenase